MNPAHKVLVATQTLLADESRWSQLAPARTPSGEICQSTTSKAAKFCLLTALIRSAEEIGLHEVHLMHFVEQAIMEITGVDAMRVSVLGFNDNADHATVMRAIGRAVELAKAA